MGGNTVSVDVKRSLRCQAVRRGAFAEGAHAKARPGHGLSLRGTAGTCVARAGA